MTRFVGQVTEFTTRSVDGKDIYTFRRLPLGDFATVEVRFKLGALTVWVPLKTMYSHSHLSQDNLDALMREARGAVSLLTLPQIDTEWEGNKLTVSEDDEEIPYEEITPKINAAIGGDAI